MDAIKKAFILTFLAAGGIILLMGNVKAEINMPEREHIQTIVRVVELLAFVSAVVVFWFVWRIGKRDSDKKKSRRKDS